MCIRDRGLTFEYSRFITGAETQVGLVKVNEQINQMIGSSEEGGYFPKNFAAFFTLGYRFWYCLLYTSKIPDGWS